MTPRSTAGRATRFVLVVTACVLAFILAAGWVVQQKIDRTKATALEIADRVTNALQVRPKVVVRHRTIVEQQSDVLKLVTLEKTVTERQRLDESWLHSTKTFEIEADFVIRAGFDLSKPFVIEVDSSRAVRATLPPAEILATEMHDVRILRDEDGLWNRLTAADREQAIRELRLRISLRARESDLREQARTNAEKRLTELLARDGRTVTFTPSLPASSGVRE
jgi:hypothetical protein